MTPPLGNSLHLLTASRTLSFFNTQPSRLGNEQRQVTWPSPEIMRVSAPVARNECVMRLSLATAGRGLHRQSSQDKRFRIEMVMNRSVVIRSEARWED